MSDKITMPTRLHAVADNMARDKHYLSAVLVSEAADRIERLEGLLREARRTMWPCWPDFVERIDAELESGE